MGSREKDQPTPHLSSLVVRPIDSGGENGGGGAGSDYEPGEVRRDAPPYSRSDRFSDTHGSSFCHHFFSFTIIVYQFRSPQSQLVNFSNYCMDLNV